MILKNVITAIIILFFISCSNQKSEFGGPPKASELIGYWKKLNFEGDDKLNKETPWPQKYQWFAFHENGKVQSIMSDQDHDYNSNELKELFETTSGDENPDYKYDGTLLFITIDHIKDYLEVWGLNLLTKDLDKNLKKGTLIMSMDNGKGEIIYYRFLKKIN